LSNHPTSINNIVADWYYYSACVQPSILKMGIWLP